MIALPSAPFDIQHRELWLPPGINNHATLPTSVEGGHELALIGAQKRTSCDGVHFNGTATSNINCGAIHNAAARLWVSLRFKLDATHEAGAGEKWIFGKVFGAETIRIQLNTANGILYFSRQGAGAFSLNTWLDTWNGGQWYHLLFSLSDLAGGTQRLLINNSLQSSDTVASAAPGGGDVVIGDIDDPGAGAGFRGVIADVFIGTDDLTPAEETDLYNGIPPADTVNEYLLDEGRGVTAYDRGSGVNNGTLDTTATWAWGRVEQPVLSQDGINDHGQSGAGVDISGSTTVVWAGKLKSTYSGLAGDHYLFRFRIDGADEIYLFYSNAADVMRFWASGSATANEIDVAMTNAIDDYVIFLLTLTASGVMGFHLNGLLVGRQTGVGAVSGADAIAWIGQSSAATARDISKPLLIALIDGAFTQKQARAYTRYINSIFNLGLTV